MENLKKLNVAFKEGDVCLGVVNEVYPQVVIELKEGGSVLLEPRGPSAELEQEVEVIISGRHGEHTLVALSSEHCNEYGLETDIRIMTVVFDPNKGLMAKTGANETFELPQNIDWQKELKPKQKIRCLVSQIFTDKILEISEIVSEIDEAPKNIYLTDEPEDKQLSAAAYKKASLMEKDQFRIGKTYRTYAITRDGSKVRFGLIDCKIINGHQNLRDGKDHDFKVVNIPPVSGKLIEVEFIK